MCSFNYRHLVFFVLAGLQACSNKKGEDSIAGFYITPQEFAVSEPALNEASGIADSKANPGYLWVEQDSGNPPSIHLLQHNGTWLKSIHLANVVNRDWEDLVLAAGPKPGVQYLYIAETGDNLLVHTDYAIYRLEEPTAAADTVKQVDKIAFFYPDGSHNAEAILVDGDTKDIYIITKVDRRSKVFKLTYPYSTTVANKAEEVGVLTYNLAVSAAISPSGKEIVVKTYDAIYSYPRKTSETIMQTLAKEPVSLPYTQEPQGEAIVFSNNDSGYYTLSEKALASSVKLYFYKRK
ncbi:hypothetical protein [Niastella sp. OAS944]|uniref:hypothetical protein n=1 Tax=Niastella sp. OAS944 TaxID=2664089 RepID=UPI003483019F|nr:hypothetical protein [Chitinophagaceae bacterium OAS944]